MKQTIEIEVPEGYEVAEGEQPRLPEKGEYFIDFGNTVAEAIDTHTPCIVLKKKAPKYRVDDVVVLGNGLPPCKMVEIKALEDLIDLFEKQRGFGQISNDEWQRYEALKELLK